MVQMSSDTASDYMVLSSESEAETSNDPDSTSDFVSFLAQFGFKPSDFSGGSSDEANAGSPIFSFLEEFDGMGGFNSPQRCSKVGSYDAYDEEESSQFDYFLRPNGLESSDSLDYNGYPRLMFPMKRQRS